MAVLVAEYYLERCESPEDYRILFVVDEASLIDQKKGLMEGWLKPTFTFLKTA